jgi:ataxia telangiectasia mutated family protein
MFLSLQKGSTKIESRKFLPLLYQLAARMSARSLATDPFQSTLQEIIFRTSVEHPHHSLYVTLALSHASMDNSFPSSGHVTGGAVKSPRPSGRLAKKNSTAASTVDEDKVKAAKGLIRRLHSERPSLVHSMEQLCEAYIDLAYHDVSAHRRERKPIKFPASCTLVKLAGKLREVAVPTVDIEVDPSCSYRNLVTIDRFDVHFQLAGGINLPKVLSCIGSDGKRRRQLVKGKDDLRQDAVMQQVFVLVNKLLQKEHTTSKRKLNIRTYKVVPLSQRSGIVEWCEGTTPLGEYLVGPQGKPFQGAHCRYRPQDWASLECRKKLMETGSKRGPSKLDTYTNITRHFRPVFHHFFTEHFPNPSEWFEWRLMYTRSVATSSIVGYVVGLGDRHVQNILIDTNSAEFIHIDLGVAFEQGKTLPTPETVPFRLTRDVVDGMGVAGVEGVFRRCCEKTMEVMRASHEELRTIVEVLLYDPLYMWTISPVKALNLQRRDESTSTAATGDQIFEGGGGPPVTGTTANGSNPSNKMAERVLLRLQEKLEGIEDGVPLSVSGQVNQLIQEATDPNNLSRLFPGWQAWI